MMPAVRLLKAASDEPKFPQKPCTFGERQLIDIQPNAQPLGIHDAISIDPSVCLSLQTRIVWVAGLWTTYNIDVTVTALPVVVVIIDL